MPQFLARCIIILVVVFIIFLFRKVLKRLIFILVLLGLSFFIYGLITPSGASALWNTVKNIPVQLAVFFGEEESVKIEESIKIKEYEGIRAEGYEGVKVARKMMFEMGHGIVSAFVEKPSLLQSDSSMSSQQIVQQPSSSQTSSVSSATSSQPFSSQTSSQVSPQTSSYGLTAQEIREAEELFSILLQ